MRTLRHELASGHIALIDLQDMPPTGHWYVTHLSQKKLSPAALAFKDFLIEQGGKLMDSWS
jgi:DNA-binding transcriptional LysR family regulator